MRRMAELAGGGGTPPGGVSAVRPACRAAFVETSPEHVLVTTEGKMGRAELSVEEIETGLRRARPILNGAADTLADHGHVRPAAAVRELCEDIPDPVRMWSWLFGLSDYGLELVKIALQESIIGCRMAGYPDAMRTLMEVHTAAEVVQKARAD